MMIGSASRSLMSTTLRLATTSGWGVNTSQPTCANQKPRLALCGSESVSLYLWCTRWSSAHMCTCRWNKSKLHCNLAYCSCLMQFPVVAYRFVAVTLFNASCQRVRSAWMVSTQGWLRSRWAWVANLFLRVLYRKSPVLEGESVSKSGNTLEQFDWRINPQTESNQELSRNSSTWEH